MAAKDKVCGNNVVALKDLDLGAWIDKLSAVDCEDQRWIGPPDPNDDLKPCADMNESRTPFAWSNAWYIVLVVLQCGFLVMIILFLPSRRRRHPPATQANLVAEDEVELGRVRELGRVILLQGRLKDRVKKRLLCGMLTHWKRLVDEILWAPGGKRYREHSLTCAAAAAMQV